MHHWVMAACPGLERERKCRYSPLEFIDSRGSSIDSYKHFCGCDLRSKFACYTDGIVFIPCLRKYNTNCIARSNKLFLSSGRDLGLA